MCLAIQSGVPVLLWGPPGVGKSSLLAAIFKALGWPCETILAAIRDPSDFCGIPVPETREDADGKYTAMAMLAPNWAQRLSQRRIGDTRAGLVLEELNQAAPSTQAGVMRVVHEGYVGDEKLGSGVARVAAANPPEQSAGGYSLATPLSNRFCHIKWTMSADYFADALVSGFPPPAVFPLPDHWEADFLPSVVGLIAAYLRAHGNAMLDVPKDEAAAGLPWPSPRSWTMGGRLMAAAESIGAPEGVVHEALAGCIGDAGALMFMEYKKSMDLPSAESMLDKPEKVVWPTNRGDKTAAMLSTVTAYAISKNDPKIWKKALQLCALAGAKYKDVGAVASKRLMNCQPRFDVPPTELEIFHPIYKEAGLCK